MKSKKGLEVLISKSEARLSRLKEMNAPNKIITMEVVHLTKLIEARIEK